ncbi:MAG: ClbS/DfsB family four-helix bundle protein [Chloroflexota bacterium]|nr:ClbS/DfsB family four-helix bundle protein [Chloroflexota bacterium]
MDSGNAGLWKPRLLDLAARGAADLHAFVAGLSAAERAARGTADHWSVKDHVAHLTVWKDQSARLLTAAGHGETPAPAPDEGEYNAQMFALWQNRSWADVLAEAKAVDARLAAAITACAEDDFAQPDRFPWRAGRPLWTLVYGNGYSHPLEHYVQLYLEADQPERALAVQQAAVTTLHDLFGDAEPYSYAVYNLACFYAKTGHAAPALAALGQALAANPTMGAWAADDADFATLHDDPAFQALTQA